MKRILHHSKRTLFAIAITCACGCSEAATDPRPQWARVSLASSNDLNAVDMLPSGSGTIVGDSGAVFATADKGRTWKKQVSPVNSTFTAVRELPNGDAVAATQQGEVLWRKSGTWSVVAYSPDALALQAIGVSGNVVYVVGGGFRNNSVSSAFVRSTDGGKNWEAVPRVSQKLFLWIKALVEVSSDRIVLVGKCYPSGFCTSNIESFDAVSEAVRHHGLSAFGAIEDIVIVKSGLGLFTGSCLAKTTDSGGTWTIQRRQEEGQSNDVDIVESGFGLIVGGAGRVEATFDGAVTWHKQPVGSTRDLNDASIGDPSFAIVVGDNGTVLRWGS